MTVAIMVTGRLTSVRALARAHGRVPSPTAGRGRKYPCSSLQGLEDVMIHDLGVMAHPSRGFAVKNRNNVMILRKSVCQSSKKGNELLEK